MTEETRVCHFCESMVGKGEPCSVCTATWHLRPDAKTMTPEARGTELESLYGVVEVSFDLLHKRIEELVGRPVWTHELVHREALIAEARGESRSTWNDVLDRLPKDKKLISIEVPEGFDKETLS